MFGCLLNKYKGPQKFVLYPKIDCILNVNKTSSASVFGPSYLFTILGLHSKESISDHFKNLQ